MIQNRVLKIGILSPEKARARTIAIARGQLKPGPDDPKIWFPSAETFGQILSGKNHELLKHIRSVKPHSIKELAVQVGRQESNLSRTLKTMARYGLVSLRKGEGGTITPEVDYDEVDLTLSLAA